MASTITALGDNAGAEVIGVNLAALLADSDRQLLREALVKHVALVFREQKLSAAEYVEAVRNFAEPVPQNFVDDRLDHPCVSIVSNTIPGMDGKRVYHASYWHTDQVNREQPPAFTSMYAIELPASGGGDTGILNTRMAYRNLSAGLRKRIENLRTVNVYSGSASPDRSHKAVTMKRSDEDLPYSHPLIRTHPDTGDKAIYLHKGKLEKFEGMTPEESHQLVAELMGEIERPEYMYRHKWRDGDLLIWDDRASMHQAFSDYDLDETRTFYRIVAGPQTPF